MNSQQIKANCNGIADRYSNSSMWNTDDGTTEVDNVYPDVKGARQWLSDMHQREPAQRQRTDEVHPDMQDSRQRADEIFPDVRGSRSRSCERKRRINASKNDPISHSLSDADN